MASVMLCVVTHQPCWRRKRQATTLPDEDARQWILEEENLNYEWNWKIEKGSCKSSSSAESNLSLFDYILKTNCFRLPNIYYTAKTIYRVINTWCKKHIKVTCILIVGNSVDSITGIQVTVVYGWANRKGTRHIFANLWPVNSPILPVAFCPR